MGYKPKRTVYKLDFSRTEHAGLEVSTKSISVDDLTRMIGLADSLEGVDPEHAGTAALQRIDELLTRFAAVMVSWNVEDDDDQPVPPTREGLGTQDFDFVRTVIDAWMTEMSSAPPPLPGASSSGQTTPESALLEASIPMAPSSPPS